MAAPASLVEQDRSEEQGRFYRASRDVAAGEVVLEEEPYALALSEQRVGNTCHHCLQDKEGTLLMPCPRCQYVRYCSDDCKLKDLGHHELECRSLRKVLPNRPPQSVRLVLRILRRWQRDRKDAGSNTDARERCETIEGLVFHRQKATRKTIERLAQMCVLVKFCQLDEETESEDTEGLPLMGDLHGLIDLFLRLEANAVTVSNPSLQPVGAALYLWASRFNHSCQPNCAAVFRGPRLRVRCLQAAARGAPLLISYVDVAAPTAARRRELKATYHFDCRCPYCLDDAREKKLDPPEAARQLPAVQAAETKLNKGNAGEARPDLEGILADLPQSDSYLKYRVLNSLVRACIEQHEWPLAFRYCHQSIPLHVSILGEVHPLTGMQLLMLGKLAWYIGDGGTARESLERAMRILVKTHGEDHVALEELRALLAQVAS